MLTTLYSKLLAALVAALIALSTASAPVAVAASGTTEAPPPPTALIPRASRTRRLRRHLGLRYIATRLLGRHREPPVARSAHRCGIARRLPDPGSYARGPPYPHPVETGRLNAAPSS